MIDEATKKALPALLRAQIAPGMFDERAVFPSSLVLSCLASIESSSESQHALERELVRFISSQKSESGTWNYMIRMKDAGPRYPDDLDSTACAIAALVRYDPHLDIPKTLADFARALICSEEREGGPYHTWLADRADGRFRDIDVAVNCNIGYALAQNDISLRSLDSYILANIGSDRPPSLYYRSRAAMLYFISRYLASRKIDDEETSGPVMENIIKESWDIARSDDARILDRALALSCAMRLAPQCGYARDAAIPRMRAADVASAILREQDEEGLWPASPLFVETTKGGIDRYHGSRALSAAFCLEALSIYRGVADKERRIKNPQNMQKIEAFESDSVTRIKNRFKGAFSGYSGCFREEAAVSIKAFESNGMDRFIILLPFSFIDALAEEARSAMKKDGTMLRLSRDLALANLFGWAGYTIEDDIVDESKHIDRLPFANACIRRSFAMYSFAAFSRKGRTYIERVFERMDTSTKRELERRDRLSCRDGDMSERSFGHALGPLVIAMRLGHMPGSTRFRALERFFRLYISARQMSDDAHDWRDDLERGHENSAYRAMIESLPIDAESIRDARALEALFWDKGIDIVSRRIEDVIARAQKAADDLSGFIDRSFFENLLAPIERSMKKAVSERDRTAAFLDRFANTD